MYLNPVAGAYIYSNYNSINLNTLKTLLFQYLYIYIYIYLILCKGMRIYLNIVQLYFDIVQCLIIVTVCTIHGTQDNRKFDIYTILCKWLKNAFTFHIIKGSKVYMGSSCIPLSQIYFMLLFTCNDCSWCVEKYVSLSIFPQNWNNNYQNCILSSSFFSFVCSIMWNIMNY